MDNFKAIVFDKYKCVGCTNCMKKCPTEAIRIRNGKATLNYERCITCGNCVRSCAQHAIHTVSDSLDVLAEHKFNVALVPSCLFAQFPHIDNPEIILNAMKNIGFDHVYEVARASDLLSLLKREEFVMGEVKTPAISVVCPACVELILTKYPVLKDNLLNHLPPLVLAAKEARAEAEKICHLDDKDIGVYYISPCPAKVKAVKSGFYAEYPEINGAISVAETCKRLQLIDVKDVKVTIPLTASNMGVSWSTSGGEAASFPNNRQLAADGIDNVISILHELEDGKLSNIDFVELHACHSGCVGGVLNVTNTFVAKSKLHTLRRTALLNKTNSVDKLDKPTKYYKISSPWKTKEVYKLDSDMRKAIEKMQKVEEILEILPHLDCGICGSPSCRAFAEDIVKGEVKIERCVVYKDN